MCLLQVLRPQKFEQVFRKVTESIEKALGEICLDKLNVSVEVKEQVTSRTPDPLRFYVSRLTLRGHQLGCSCYKAELIN